MSRNTAGKQSSGRGSAIRRIAFDAILAAVYYALTTLTIVTPSIKITFASLALVTAALLFGPLDAMAVALVGEFLYQVILFGVTATTPIWLLPPVLHALCLGLCALLLGKEKPLVERTVLCFAACMVCGVLNAVFNTAALFADSKIYGYYNFRMIFILGFARAGIALATAAVVTAVAIPLVRTLRARVPGLAES